VTAVTVCKDRKPKHITQTLWSGDDFKFNLSGSKAHRKRLAETCISTLEPPQLERDETARSEDF
jgi:hypothetical protein